MLDINLVNLTNHDVVIYSDDNDEIVATIEPSGQIARVANENIPWGIPLPYGTANIPVYDTHVADVIGLPDPQDKTVYIVSSAVAIALADKRRDLLCPDTGPNAIRINERVIGTRSLRRFVR